MKGIILLIFLILMVFLLTKLPYWIFNIIIIIPFYIFLRVYYIIYVTKDMKKVEQYILAEKNKEPIYQLAYAQAFGTIEDQFEAIDCILSKHKIPYIKLYYKALKSYLKEDYHVALQEVELIKVNHLRNYFKALIYATIGEKEQALQFKINKRWMKEAILAMIAYSEKNKEEFHIHSNHAIEYARGLQRYSLIANFRSLQKKMNVNL